jgi:divalent metal cation (Fe/Co/Zn/Cd) transporter
LLTKITGLANAEPSIVRTAAPLSSYLSPHEILVVLPAEFAPDLPAAQLTQIIERLRAAIKAAHPDVRHVFIQPVAAGQMA